jgi:hypothetical protein
MATEVTTPDRFAQYFVLMIIVRHYTDFNSIDQTYNLPRKKNKAIKKIS